MTLKEVREFISKLPSEVDDFECVNGEMSASDKENIFILVNKPIVSIYADVPNQEIQFFHQTEKDVKDLITKNHVTNK